jgi:hypothetical protein
MPAQRRAAALVISVVAGSCVLLSGCGGGSSSSGGSPANSTNGSASGGTMQRLGSTSGTHVKLTGHFCTDFKNIGQNIKVPTDATGSLTALKQHGVQYLDQAAAYFNKVAAEAPPQAGKELRVIASDYQAMAASISSGNVGSLAKIEQRMVSLTTKGTAGNAFRQLIAYMVTNCTAA